MHRLIPAVAVAGLLIASLAGCASASPAASTPAPVKASSPAAASAPASAASGSSADGSGTITFTGTYNGTMTIDQCLDGVTELTVKYTGNSTVTSGGIDSLLDFGFNGPKGEQFIPTSHDEKPTKVGKTYTVKNAKLAFQNESVTANGSVTCP